MILDAFWTRPIDLRTSSFTPLSPVLGLVLLLVAAFKSEITYLIWEYLKEAGIQIPSSQRDLYIKEWQGPEPLSPEPHLN